MYIGVDIGGSKILIATSLNGSTITDSQKIATPSDSDLALTLIQDTIRDLTQGQRIKAIGIAAPGPLDFTKGRLLTPANLPWRNVELVKPIVKAFKVPVILEHDSNTGALAETMLGAAIGAKAVLYVTISTGVGTGVIINGQIYRGSHDSEGGHITIKPDGRKCSCGGFGHFEAQVSGRAIIDRFGVPAYAITSRDTWNHIAAEIALGLSTLSAILSPEIIVLGGGVSTHYDRFGQLLDKHFARLACPLYPPPKIVPAKNLETSAVLGALILAKQAAK